MHTHAHAHVHTQTDTHTHTHTHTVTVHPLALTPPTTYAMYKVNYTNHICINLWPTLIFFYSDGHEHTRTPHFITVWTQTMALSPLTKH